MRCNGREAESEGVFELLSDVGPLPELRGLAHLGHGLTPELVGDLLAEAAAFGH